MDYEQTLDAALADVKATLLKKHHDYGTENLMTDGVFGIVVRSSDKLARIRNLLNKPADVHDENIIDTWRDLAGYALQALVLFCPALSSPNVPTPDQLAERLYEGFCPSCNQKGKVVFKTGIFGDAREFVCECGAKGSISMDQMDFFGGDTRQILRALIDDFLKQPKTGVFHGS